MTVKVTQTISGAPPAAGTFTAAIPSKTRGTLGLLNISIYGATWAGTVTLQRAFDGGSTWRDVDTFTANEETQLYDNEAGVNYRIGIKSGEYSSGSVAVRLSR